MRSLEISFSPDVMDWEADSLEKINYLLKNGVKEISDENLRVLESELGDTVKHFKHLATESFKYAIPLYPLKEAFERRNEEGYLPQVDGVFGATGLNIPMGIITGLHNSLELLGNYKDLLKTRREMSTRSNTREEIENPLISTADVVAKLKASFLGDPIYKKILDISYRNTENFIAPEQYNDAQEMAMFVEARQKSINQILLGEKEKLGISQVVEIGAGLSTRSMQLAEDFDTFYDTDLKDNVKVREEIVGLDPNPNVVVQEYNALSNEQAIELSKKLDSEPVGVVAEGVFTYFTKEQIESAFENIKVLLSHGGAAVFDIATQKGLDADRSSWSSASRDLLQNFYRSSNVKKEELAFKDLKEAKEYFKSLGFDVRIADLQGGMTDKDSEKYDGIEDGVKQSILEAPCIMICEMPKEDEIKKFFNSSSSEFYNRLNISADEITVSEDGKMLEFPFEPGPEAQGYESIAHGGYIATILDTGNLITIEYAKQLDKQAYNVHFEIDYKKPMELGKKYRMTSKLEEIKPGSKAEVISEITNQDGEVICTSKSLVLIAKKLKST